MLVTAQMIGDLVILGVVLKLVVGAAQLSRRRLAAGDPSAAGAVSTTGPGSQDLPSSQDPPQQPAGVERHVGH
jgi:hypothetical protein